MIQIVHDLNFMEKVANIPSAYPAMYVSCSHWFWKFIVFIFFNNKYKHQMDRSRAHSEKSVVNFSFLYIFAVPRL